MVDIETLGTRPGAVIVSIGGVFFDDDGIDKPFYSAIDVFSSLMAGLVVDTEAVAWWRKQSNEARGPLLNGRHGLGAALQDFARWIDGAVTVWAKGPDFDLVLLQAAYELLGQQIPWSYRNARDVRTVLALADVDPIKSGTKHHALDDAKAQAESVQRAYHALGKKLGPGDRGQTLGGQVYQGIQDTL
jgi:hypothetical protein